MDGDGDGNGSHLFKKVLITIGYLCTRNATVVIFVLSAVQATVEALCACGYRTR